LCTISSTPASLGTLFVVDVLTHRSSSARAPDRQDSNAAQGGGTISDLSTLMRVYEYLPVYRAAKPVSGDRVRLTWQGWRAGRNAWVARRLRGVVVLLALSWVLSMIYLHGMAQNVAFLANAAAYLLLVCCGKARGPRWSREEIDVALGVSLTDQRVTVVKAVDKDRPSVVLDAPADAVSWAQVSTAMLPWPWRMKAVKVTLGGPTGAIVSFEVGGNDASIRLLLQEASLTVIEPPMPER
jgi:hypothetical protein